MLILDRQPGQTIKIGDDIDVVFLGVFHGPNGPVARIGIGAPADVSVHREEIWLRIQRELDAQGSSTQSTAQSPARPDVK